MTGTWRAADHRKAVAADERADGELPATVDDVIEQHAPRIGSAHRPQKHDVGAVDHHAIRPDWRELQVRRWWVGRVEFAVYGAGGPAAPGGVARRRLGWSRVSGTHGCPRRVRPRQGRQPGWPQRKQDRQEFVAAAKFPPSPILSRRRPVITGCRAIPRGQVPPGHPIAGMIWRSALPSRVPQPPTLPEHSEHLPALRHLLVDEALLALRLVLRDLPSARPTCQIRCAGAGGAGARADWAAAGKLTPPNGHRTSAREFDLAPATHPPRTGAFGWSDPRAFGQGPCGAGFFASRHSEFTDAGLLPRHSLTSPHLYVIADIDPLGVGG